MNSPNRLLLPLALFASASAFAADDGPLTINGCVLQPESQCANADLRGADLGSVLRYQGKKGQVGRMPSLPCSLERSDFNPKPIFASAGACRIALAASMQPGTPILNR